MSSPRSKSSREWLKEHFSDPYVLQAQQEGFRGRAVYKLQQLQDKKPFIKKGMCVVDLGAAPGSWSQLASHWVGSAGKVIALDLLPIAPITGVSVLQGDFRDAACLESLIQLLNGSRIDVVLSDMAPNTSGVVVVDQARSMALAELAFDFAQSFLNQDGVFLVKVFMGEGFDRYLLMLKKMFVHVKVCKPDASRSRSREIYILSQGLRATSVLRKHL